MVCPVKTIIRQCLCQPFKDAIVGTHTFLPTMLLPLASGLFALPKFETLKVQKFASTHQPVNHCFTPTQRGALASSVTTFGDFRTFLGTNDITKVAQKIGSFLDYFETHHILSKNWYGYFLATFENCLATFHSNIWSQCFLLLLFVSYFYVDELIEKMLFMRTLNFCHPDNLEILFYTFTLCLHLIRALSRWLATDFMTPSFTTSLTLPTTGNTHLLGKGNYHCIADLLFDCFRFSFFAYV